MENLLPLIPWWAFVLLGLCLIGLLAMIGMAVFTFVLKVGVAINEARKPPHMDTGDYRLNQGHEVRPETARRRDGGDVDAR